MGTCSSIIADMKVDCSGVQLEEELTPEQLAQQEKRRKRAQQVARNHKSMYKRRRKALVAAMGGECCQCGKKRKLEFHHPNGRDWDTRKLARWTRIKKYEEEWAAGKIELLCKSCNAGYNPKKEAEDDEYEYCEVA